MFIEFESLAAWNTEVENRRQEFKKHLKATSEKVAKSRKQTEDMFNEIEGLGLWKLEVEQRKESNMKKNSF